MSLGPTARIRSDFWVSAHLRRCASIGVVAMLRRRGSAESGAILVKVDRLDGTALLFGPAPQSEAEPDGMRRFALVHVEPWIDSAAAEARLLREIRFDSDVWIVEIEDREGRAFLDG